MTCPNERCEIHDQEVTGRNAPDMTPRETCPVCGETLVTEDHDDEGN